MIELFNVPALEEQRLRPSEINCPHPQGSRPDGTEAARPSAPCGHALSLPGSTNSGGSKQSQPFLSLCPLYLLPGRHLGIFTMWVGTSPALPTTEAQAAAGSWVNPQLPLPMGWSSEVKPLGFISTGGHTTRQPHTNTGQAFLNRDLSRLCRAFKLSFHAGI